MQEHANSRSHYPLFGDAINSGRKQARVGTSGWLSTNMAFPESFSPQTVTPDNGSREFTLCIADGMAPKSWNTYSYTYVYIL